ncbi:MULTISPECIES: aldose epimerase family protein [Fusobacterium]|uniref:aldose epimerase family protein n=1 Tax=Fusobacterium TaxID=848 RepID=UPI001476DABF|nr:MULTISPECIES: aldose epimerase family protein [Fusobacterium]NME35925.1 galactose mutarotase [Fusobacterium sp. FSA-380-WT-3A]
MKIIEKYFGLTKKNQEVKAYTLKNEFLEVEILNYGGIIRKIITSDKNGNFENIVLGFDNIEDYEKKVGIHFGAIVGRNAGRIKDGLLMINGKTYELEKNNGNNNLHGYPEHYAAKIWNVEKKEEEDKLSLILTRISPHLEGNFPGEIKLKVIYTLNKNILEIDYEGIPDRDTYMNLTNHSYFNLSGDLKEKVDEQIIELHCDEYIEVDKATLPIRISKVENTIMDMRKGKKFSEIFNSEDEQIKIVGNGLDHPFIFNGKDEIVAKFIDEKSGRVMEVITDQPVGVIYTGNYVKDAEILSNGIKAENHMGFCIETQDYPDVIKFLPEKSKIYNNKNVYKQKTKFIFSLK